MTAEPTTEGGILQALRGADFGLTIEEVSKQLSISRITASKYLLVLEAKGRCRCRAVGKAKLFYVHGGNKRG